MKLLSELEEELLQNQFHNSSPYGRKSPKIGDIQVQFRQICASMCKWFHLKLLARQSYKVYKLKAKWGMVGDDNFQHHEDIENVEL